MSDQTKAATSTWVITFEYQTCFDDGGIGHDIIWRKGQHRLERTPKTDNAAVKAAKAWVQSQSGRYPCRSYCGNKGLYRFVDVEHVVPEQRRSAVADSGSSGAPRDQP